MKPGTTISYIITAFFCLVVLVLANPAVATEKAGEGGEDKPAVAAVDPIDAEIATIQAAYQQADLEENAAIQKIVSCETLKKALAMQYKALDAKKKAKESVKDEGRP